MCSAYRFVNHKLYFMSGTIKIYDSQLCVISCMKVVSVIVTFVRGAGGSRLSLYAVT